MEITVKSVETIKPFSPTPHHLQHLKLSLLDQLMSSPLSFIHVLLFYSSNGDINRFCSTFMKESLSKVLTQFYPVAGKYETNGSSILCNDEGLEYSEARVKAPLTLGEFISSPKPLELNQLLPEEAHLDKLSAVRVTFFDACGGMAVGVSISHLVADALSLATFVNSWATIARGDALAVTPKFGFASLLPPRERPQPLASGSDEMGAPLPPKLVTKRFVFDQIKINTLKANFVYQHPSRVEVVSALIFKCFINVAKSSSSKSLALSSSINLRTRMNPPLPTHYFGNLALPLLMKHNDPDSLNDIGVQLRKLFKQADGDGMEKLLANDALLLSEKIDELPKDFMNTFISNIRIFRLASWCRFPFYEINFGWGTPAWATTFYLEYQDDIVLMDTKNGGVETWVTMDEDDMARFESDDELLKFASLNPIIYET